MEVIVLESYLELRKPEIPYLLISFEQGRAFHFKGSIVHGENVSVDYFTLSRLESLEYISLFDQPHKNEVLES